jgi:hypothetical protein
VLTIMMCCATEKNHHEGQNRPRSVSEPVHKDKGKTTATEPEDDTDPKRAHVVLSKGCVVVGLSYLRLIGATAKVTDRGENSGNSSRVNQVSKMEQHYLSWVSWVSRVNQNSSTNRCVGRVSQVGNPVQKIGGSSRVANTESRVMENLANMESHVMEYSANTESQVT